MQCHVSCPWHLAVVPSFNVSRPRCDGGPEPLHPSFLLLRDRVLAPLPLSTALPSLFLSPHPTLLIAQSHSFHDVFSLFSHSQTGPEDERLEALYDRLEELDPNTFESRAASLLHGLGFTQTMME